MNPIAHPRRRARPLALDLVEALSLRIVKGHLPPGTKLPTEGQFMDEFGVSRTVVREALSKLQAGGLVLTRHGIGTFVVGPGDHPRGFRIEARDLATLGDVIAVLELRIGVETEAAALAAQRRTAANLAEMRSALDDFAAAVAAGRDAVAPDFRFHGEVARATQNAHFAGLLDTLGAKIIPRARLEPLDGVDAERRAYLLRVNAEHESIFEAIANHDAEAARAAMRTHLANSRERRRRSVPRSGAAASVVR